MGIEERPYHHGGSVDMSMQRVLDLAKGNPGATTALVELSGQRDSDRLLNILEENDIAGPLIWVGYKDHCGHDTEMFAECLRNRDEDMFAEIEAYRKRIEKHDPERAEELFG